MNAHELAARLNGREYLTEMTGSEVKEAKESGLVVVFGASDDAVELRGAVHDEVDAWGGATAYFTQAGLLTNECDDADCPYFRRAIAAAVPIHAKWCVDDYSWTYDTPIPHASFDVFENGIKYCRGIVFALSDVGGVI